ncbi:hypothetical protein [Tianweitania sediminis]|uniref:Uncharacterized protein n=1 Tax=Tianweitania sediminis TaxID=1502156 RepID=A0A8J7R058_9HYPH|nr:hypothetical protein [Tianweitania sediminis]MBP0438118.1 hypothetical protein [Tianweitania sediminis]
MFVVVAGAVSVPVAGDVVAAGAVVVSPVVVVCANAGAARQDVAKRAETKIFFIKAFLIDYLALPNRDPIKPFLPGSMKVS